MQATAGGARMTTAVGTWEETVAEMGGPGGGIYQDYLAIDGSIGHSEPCKWRTCLRM